MKKLTLIFSMLIALVGLNANAAMYIVGNNPFGNWHTYAGEEMTDNGNGVYTYVTDQIGGTVWFVFADGLTTGTSDDWSTFNNNYRYGPLTSGQAIQAGVEYTTQKSTNGDASYSFAGTLGEPYQFTFDTNTMKFKVEGYVAPVVIGTYSIAGTPASIFGAEWSETNTATEMTLVNGLYTWTKEGVELTSGTNIQFKVVGNHDWGHAWPASNYSYDITENGTYNLTFTFNAETEEVGLTAELVEVGPVVNPITGKFYVLGQVNGNNWDPSAGIEMSTVDENVYTLTDANITDSGDGYGFFSFTSKLGENADDWSIASYRRGALADGTEVVDGVSATLNDWGTSFAFKALPGIYDIEVSLSDNYVLLTKKGGEEPPVEMIYTVVGPETIFGSDWDETDQENDMVKGQDGIYTWTKTDVALYGNFEFKVVGNHDYEIYEWPIGMNNWVANVAEEGIYTIVITFDPEAADADRITCTLTKTGDVEPIEHVYTVAGTENLFGSNWDVNDEANNMVKNENGIYVWTKNGVEFAEAVNIQFKVVQDHAWVYSWPSNNWYADLEAGKYNIVITFDPAADDMNKITFTATPVVDPAYIRGDVNMDETVSIGDVTALIDYLLTQDASGVSLDAADCNLDEGVTIGDVTSLIDYLLTNEWPAE